MRWWITNEALSAELAIIIAYPSKRQWNDCFIKNAHKISRILPDFIIKTTDFQLVFNFEQTRTVTIFGGHGIMPHTMMALELHYPMIF